MTDRNDMPPTTLLARKGEARPAITPVNDNPAPVARITIGPASTSIATGLASGAMVSAAIALAGGRRAAVTLRLDPARHLRLRLACAIGGRSAETIIGDALDAHLKTIAGIDRLMAEAMAGGGDQAATGWGKER